MRDATILRNLAANLRKLAKLAGNRESAELIRLAERYEEEAGQFEPQAGPQLQVRE